MRDIDFFFDGLHHRLDVALQPVCLGEISIGGESLLHIKEDEPAQSRDVLRVLTAPPTQNSGEFFEEIKVTLDIIGRLEFGADMCGADPLSTRNGLVGDIALQESAPVLGLHRLELFDAGTTGENFAHQRIGPDLFKKRIQDLADMRTEDLGDAGERASFCANGPEFPDGVEQLSRRHRLLPREHRRAVDHAGLERSLCWAPIGPLLLRK